jgi:acetyl-CoA C-acetyltransferase
MNNATMVDTMGNDGFWMPKRLHMGITPKILRSVGHHPRVLDAFECHSTKTAAAQASARCNDEIVPVPIRVKKDIVDFRWMKFRAQRLRALAKLKPAFKKDGRVTAGNSSGINDGAAAILLASGEAVKKYGLKPLFKLVSWGQGGVDPKIMGVGPVPASKQALEKAGLKIDDIDLIEANEAFAAQSIAVARELGFDMAKVNLNGGALSLGHPVGASGARIIVTLVYEMLKRDDCKLGLATLCIGGGMGNATIWEKV